MLETEINWTKLLFWSVLFWDYGEGDYRWYLDAWKRIIWPNSVDLYPPNRLKKWRLLWPCQSPLLPRDLSPSQQPAHSIQSKLSTAFSLTPFLSGRQHKSTWSEHGEKSCQLLSCCWCTGRKNGQDIMDSKGQVRGIIKGHPLWTYEEEHEDMSEGGGGGQQSP
jgi:hypothetical protein